MKQTINGKIFVINLVFDSRLALSAQEEQQQKMMIKISNWGHKKER